MSTASVPRGATQRYPENALTETRARAAVSTGLPWYIWCSLAAITSAQIGGHWDISWHESIGRDSFWTPAHIAIYACGVLAGIAFGYMILHTTFNRNSPLRAASVRILGLRGPIGAFIASWGGIAMLVSAPFDNWWHDAYGLDVKIVSPPHLVLFAGVYAVMIGTAVMIAGHMNRSTGVARTWARGAFLYAMSMLVIGVMVLLMEFIGRTHLHSSLPYLLMSLLIPIPLTVGSRVTGFRYAATLSAAIYTLFLLGFILILPLFPAQPKLGPVYQHVTTFVPPQFPILLIVPAFLLDWYWSFDRSETVWRKSLASAGIFVVSLLAAEWPFASFLMTPASRNAIFATGYFEYELPPWSFLARNLFYQPDTPSQLMVGALMCIAIATVTFRFGLMRGNWMRSVQR